MQVSNNCQSPNFGMSFRVPKNIKCVTDFSPESIKQAQEALKGTKTWHLTLMDNGQPRIYSNKDDAFVSEFTVTRPSDHTLKINTRWDGYSYKLFTIKGQRYCERVDMETKEAAKSAYQKIKQAPTLLDRIVEIVKVLDNFKTLN